MSDRSDQAAIYDDIADLAEDLHRLVAILAVYPPEVAAMVTHAALKDTAIKGKRKRRFASVICGEVARLRIALAAGDPVPFPAKSSEPEKEAA